MSTKTETKKKIATPVHCGDCGWKGKRVNPLNAAYLPHPCPKCGSRAVYETPAP